MRKAPRALLELVRGVVQGLGYEFVGLELSNLSGAGAVLRVYIDQVEGIQLDDCEAVSRQLSGVLDVEDPIKREYSLEVSSPGLDRPLFEPEHFRRFVGKAARVRLSSVVPGRRKYTGVIGEVVDDGVCLVVDGEKVHLPFAQIESARLVPEF